jgi:hypothetical protein
MGDIILRHVLHVVRLPSAIAIAADVIQDRCSPQ